MPIRVRNKSFDPQGSPVILATMSSSQKQLAIARLNKRINNCHQCRLSRKRTLAVAGAGNLNARIMLIGEAPGQHEDQSGQPFVGRSGKILDRLLKASGLTRPQIYISSILKCRPPHNRNPLQSEILACAGILEAQLKIIGPSLIAPLGNFATNYFFAKYHLSPVRISEVHGRIFDVVDSEKRLFMVPLFHPAVAVYNASRYPVLKKDFLILKKFI